MSQLQVNLSNNPYDIIIDHKIDYSRLISFISDKQVLIVSNTVVSDIYLNDLVLAIENKCSKLSQVILEDGESAKSKENLFKILDNLLSEGYNRSSTVVLALGGGVIGDISGFAASIYQRGVSIVQIPTTLLSQVDSSVGGKTAINHELGKNMIGSFYQPDLVYTSVSFLDTLNDREYKSGLAEVVKYAFISKDFYQWLSLNSSLVLAKDMATISEMIKRCCQIKAQIVLQDEKELAGVRALLNFGHTFGHAIEKCQRYSGLKHGEAVAIGMILAIKLSYFIGMISKDECKSYCQFIEKFNFSLDFPKDINRSEFLSSIKLDKKNSLNKFKFILVNKCVGSLEVVNVEDNIIDKFIQENILFS